eukprot:1585825-Alexandrium_andersonii.AAC.1
MALVQHELKHPPPRIARIRISQGDTLENTLTRLASLHVFGREGTRPECCPIVLVPEMPSRLVPRGPGAPRGVFASGNGLMS